MRDAAVPYGHIRRLFPGEAALYAAHLARLGPESRRRRFAHAVSPAFAADHARRALAGGLVFGWFDGARLGAAAELAPLAPSWRNAELALSVEAPFRRRGIGSRLLKRLLRTAGNRGVRRLQVLHDADNEAMSGLLRPYAPLRRHREGQVFASLAPPAAGPASILREMAEDGESAAAGLAEALSGAAGQLLAPA